jgi:phosphoglycolate phosphatase
VRPVLVLWDVDYTLADTGGLGLRLYEIAFAEMFGGELPPTGSMAGRTDRAIVREVLTRAGIADPAEHVAAFEALLAKHAPSMADAARLTGRALPGAVAAVVALAGLPASEPPRQVVQALLTGNIREMAEVKLGPLGLLQHLDLEAGAYGTESDVRADLVGAARKRAAARYGTDFGGRATVLVGDTPLDVAAATGTGARAVGVATGRFSAAQLAAAGADAVLADLADTGAVLAAVLGD